MSKQVSRREQRRQRQEQSHQRRDAQMAQKGRVIPLPPPSPPAPEQLSPWLPCPAWTEASSATRSSQRPRVSYGEDESWRERMRQEFADYPLDQFPKEQDLEGGWQKLPQPLADVLRLRSAVVKHRLQEIRTAAWVSAHDPDSHLEEEPFTGVLTDQDWEIMGEEIEDSERQLGQVLVLTDPSVTLADLYAFLHPEGRGWMIYRIPGGWVFAAACTEFEYEAGVWDELYSEVQIFQGTPHIQLELPRGYELVKSLGTLSVVKLYLSA